MWHSTNRSDVRQLLNTQRIIIGNICAKKLLTPRNANKGIWYNQSSIDCGRPNAAGMHALCELSIISTSEHTIHERTDRAENMIAKKWMRTGPS